MNLFRRVSVLIGISLMAFSLGGCGSISSFMAGSMGDFIPTWMGGLPADAPPRPGTAKYDEFMRQQELKRQEATTKGDNVQPSDSSSAATIR